MPVDHNNPLFKEFFAKYTPRQGKLVCCIYGFQQGLYGRPHIDDLGTVVSMQSFLLALASEQLGWTAKEALAATEAYAYIMTIVAGDAAEGAKENKP